MIESIVHCIHTRIHIFIDIVHMYLYFKLCFIHLNQKNEREMLTYDAVVNSIVIQNNLSIVVYIDMIAPINQRIINTSFASLNGRFKNTKK